MGLGYPSRPRLVRRCTAGRLAAGALLAAAFAPLAAQAQDVDTGTARAQAALLEPGSIENVADMDFGRIAQQSTLGTVVLSPHASATCTVTGGLVRTGACQAARFTVRRRNQAQGNIMLRNTTLSVTLNGPGSATMQVTNITMSAVGMVPTNGGNGWNLGRHNINASSGIADFWLGGTLHVGAAQAPGVYNGVIVIEANFN